VTPRSRVIDKRKGGAYKILKTAEFVCTEEYPECRATDYWGATIIDTGQECDFKIRHSKIDYLF
jgi:hypothetical protein